MTKMTKKHLIGAVVILIIIAGAAFWGGMAYGKGQAASARAAAFGNFVGGTGAAGRTGFTGRTGAAGGGTAGKIISTSQGSITVELPSGSTQIVLLGDTTQILKTTSGSAADLTTGTNVVVSGPSNSDGSLTASSVQVRPAGAPGSQ